MVPLHPRWQRASVQRRYKVQFRFLHRASQGGVSHVPVKLSKPPAETGLATVVQCRSGSAHCSGRAVVHKMLTRDEARRITANAKLPEAVTAITRWIKGPTGRPRFLPVSRPPPGRDGAYAASVPQPPKFDGLGLKRSARL